MAQMTKDGSDNSKVNVGPGDARPADEATSDDTAQRALDEGDDEKIDKVLDELDVTTTRSGADQTSKPDTEGSNSSSKNLDEQNE